MAKFYLTILEGDNVRTAKPVVATTDQRIIQQVADEIGRRLNTTSKPSTPARNQGKGDAKS